MKNRPQLWFQPGLNGAEFDQNSLLWGSRLRIIYPDGKCEWSPYASGVLVDGYYDFNEIPCWTVNCKNQIRSAEDALAFMHAYDEKHCYPPAEFLGYL